LPLATCHLPLATCHLPLATCHHPHPHPLSTCALNPSVTPSDSPDTDTGPRRHRYCQCGPVCASLCALGAQMIYMTCRGLISCRLELFRSKR
jgi:hypothetical protein